MLGNPAVPDSRALRGYASVVLLLLVVVVVVVVVMLLLLLWLWLLLLLLLVVVVVVEVLLLLLLLVLVVVVVVVVAVGGCASGAPDRAGRVCTALGFAGVCEKNTPPENNTHWKIIHIRCHYSYRCL